MAYSLEIKYAVVRIYETGKHIQKEIAEMFKISIETVRKYIKEYREKGFLEKKIIKRDTRTKIKNEDLLKFKEMIDNNNDKTLNEYVDLWLKNTGISVSIETIRRTLKRINYTFKKKLGYIEKEIPNYKKSLKKK